MADNIINIKFRRDNDFFLLPFKLRSSCAAQKWFSSIRKAAAKSEIIEGDRWYNFPNHKYESFAKIEAQLNQTIRKINELSPGQIPDYQGTESLQQKVNRLHLEFADSHLVTDRITAENSRHWVDFNNILHAYETLERSLYAKKNYGIDNSSIVFIWKEHFLVPLEENDYSEFTVRKKFGTCYVNYCQVGRHFYEMFQAQDDVADDKHIRPLENISADTYLWLGPETGNNVYIKRMIDIEKWFKAREKRFNKLGFYWGDPKLAIGWLPVADLVKCPKEITERNNLIDHLSTYDSVEGVTVQKSECIEPKNF